MKPILDMCCGSKMFYFNKNNPQVVFMDKRKSETTLCDGRMLRIEPDIVADFRKIPFPSNSFYMVVFDPPHLLKVGQKSWLAKKYGQLGQCWRNDLKQGFDEAMRVLRPYGTLIFKWNEQQIKLKEILNIFNYPPPVGT